MGKDFFNVGEGVDILFNLLKNTQLKPVETEILTYKQVIQFFIENQPKGTEEFRGVILKEPHDNGCIVRQVFLDKENNIINNNKGRPIINLVLATRIDDELNEYFDDKDTIIVE